MKIGLKIRELRQSAEISQETLARALSVTPQAISRWENGTTAPDISLLPVIANYFEVSSMYCFTMILQPPSGKLNASSISIIVFFRNLKKMHKSCFRIQ